jgi:hypothetical protein
LWSSGEKAEALHALFLKDPAAFKSLPEDPIVWNDRMSINFISWLGSDLVHIPDIMADDEHELCYGVRKRARKVNCIYSPFIASHLSFWKQEAQMNVEKLMAAYRELADAEIDASSPPLERRSVDRSAQIQSSDRKVKASAPLSAPEAV